MTAETTEERMRAESMRMAAEAGQERARVEALLKDIHFQREVKRSAEKEGEKLSEQVKHWMTTNRETLVEDPERGYEGEIQESRTKTYDVLHMPDELVVALARRGALKVDAAVLKALAGKAADIDQAERYADEGKVTVKLIVRKKGN